MLRDKKILLRLILFLLALGVAIYAFVNGVLQLGHRDSGYYDLDPTLEGQAELFGSGVHLVYYFEGNSNEIRQKTVEVQKVYTDIQLRYYRLLDARTTYEGITNLASLNQSPDTWLTLDPVLLEVLSDAQARTDRGEGYSLLAGPLHQEWQNLRYLEEPQDSDPLNDPEEARKLEQLTALVHQPEEFVLTLDAAGGRAQLHVGEAYRQWNALEELDAPILDLNLLHDAYLLRFIARDMTERGYTDGYLYTDSGLSVMLDPAGTTVYTLIGSTDKGVAPLGEMRLDAPSAFVQFTAFMPTDSPYGYYTVSRGGETLLRHTYVDLESGDFRNVLLTAYLGADPDSLVEMAYEAVALNQLSSAEAVRARVSALPEGWTCAYTLQNNDKKLYAAPASADRITPDSESGYTLLTLP